MDGGEPAGFSIRVNECGSLDAVAPLPVNREGSNQAADLGHHKRERAHGHDRSAYSIHHHRPAGGGAHARADSDLEMAFATFSQQRVGAVLVSDSAFFGSRAEQLAALAARHALPAIYSYREHALAGGLMS